jgi:hypothetical protein
MEVIVMFAAWLGAILIILMPNLFDFFSRKIAVSRSFDLAVIGGFVFVIPLVYLSYIRTRRIEKKIEDFVRKEVLRERAILERITSAKKKTSKKK